MSRQPLVSIVIPTYNRARLLREAVESCRRQTYRNWEMIIVYDLSGDDTLKVIEEFTGADNRIRAVPNASPNRLPGALNTGLRLAKGDYFTWHCDDNLYRERAIEEMVQVLEANPDVGVVYADYTLIDEHGKPLGLMPAFAPEENPFINWTGCCFLYRRAVQEKVGDYSEDLFLAEDYDFWLRAIRQFPFFALHKDLMLFRIHAETLTEAYKPRVRSVSAVAIARNIGGMRWLTRAQRAEFYVRYAEQARREDKAWRARLRLLHALMISPVAALRKGGWKWALATFAGPKLLALRRNFLFGGGKSKKESS